MQYRTFLAWSIGSSLLMSAPVLAQSQAAPAGSGAPAMGQMQPATPNPDAPAPTSEEDQARQQMQETMQQIMQNMVAKGIDPMQFFQEMRSGGDPSELQQKMLDLGIIDKQMITKMQGSFQSLALSRIKQQLEVTDQEWTALLPKVQRVLTAQTNVDRRSMSGGGGGRGMGGFLGAQDTDLANALKGLRATVKDQNASPDDFAIKLASFRSAYEKATSELTDAQNDLASVLTVRQEAILAAAGVLQ